MITSSVERKQKGFALVWMVMLPFIIMVVALAVDSGRVYFEIRQLQTMANSLASELADEGQACFGGELSAGAIDLTSIAEGKLEEHSGVTVDAAKVVLVEGNAGKYEVQEVGDARGSNGVAVSLSRPVTGLLAFAMGDLSAHAVARKEVEALFSVSGVVLDVGGNTDRASVLNVVLGALFNDGARYSIPVDGLDSLRDFTVDLGDFVDDAGVGVALNQLPVDAYDLADAIRTIAHSAGESELAGFADDLLKSSVNLRGVSIEQIFRVVGESAVIPSESRIPIYDLLIVTALNALEGITLPLSDIGLDIAGLASVSGSIRVLEAPGFVLAPARKPFLGSGEDEWIGESSGANISVNLITEINLPLIILGTGLEADIDLPLSISVGNANAKFVSAVCAAGNNNDVIMGFRGNTSAAKVEGSADILTTLSLLGIPIELVGTRLAIDVPVGMVNYYEDDDGLMPARSLDNFEPIEKRVGEGLGLSFDGAGLRIEGHPESKGGLPTVVNALLAPIVALLSGVLETALSGLLETLADLVLDPLLATLGVGVGEGNIQVTAASQANTHIIECERALCQPVEGN